MVENIGFIETVAAVELERDKSSVSVKATEKPTTNTPTQSLFFLASSAVQFRCLQFDPSFSCIASRLTVSKYISIYSIALDLKDTLLKCAIWQVLNLSV